MGKCFQVAFRTKRPCFLAVATDRPEGDLDLTRRGYLLLGAAL